MPGTASPQRRLYGTDEPQPAVRSLRAGPLNVELQHDRLRHIRCGPHELWHALAFVLRDPDWGTPDPVIHRLDLDDGDDRFEVRIAATVHSPGQAMLDCGVHIIGSASGTISLDTWAKPRADLRVNRLGLCLLHPLTACGRAVEVEHVDGRRSHGHFPTLIPPWPPFTLVRALRHEWTDGCWALARLEGDVFETEDQRHNADASFKTYSRSNLAHRPYTLHAGEVLRQRAELSVDAASLQRQRGSTSRRSDPAPPVSVKVTGERRNWPSVGVELMAEDLAEPVRRARNAALLVRLEPGHLHWAWQAGQPVPGAALRSSMDAASARLRVDVDLHGVGDVPQALNGLASALAASGVEPESLALFPPTPAAIEAARRGFPQARVGSGTPHFFVQLSRLDFLGPVDFASFTTASVVHGADDDEVMLGLGSLAHMVRTWRARHPSVPLRVGPSAIGARTSPLGALDPGDGVHRRALSRHDPRHAGQFAAAWALGHLAALAGAGVDAVTLLALSGPAGLCDDTPTQPQPQPQRRASFELLARLGRPTHVRCVDVSDGSKIAALAVQQGSQLRLLLGNLTARPAAVTVDGPDRVVVGCARLDAQAPGPPAWQDEEPGARDAQGWRLTLAPYGISEIRWGPDA